MLDIGWTELVVIAIVLIVVVGPKDLPPMLRAFGRMTKKMRGMAADFRTQFDEALREADLEDVKKTIGETKSLNPMSSLREAMNPLRDLGNEIKSDLQKATKPDAPSTTVTPDLKPELPAETPIASDATVAPVPATATPSVPASVASPAVSTPATPVAPAAEVAPKKPRAPRKTAAAAAAPVAEVAKPKAAAKPRAAATKTAKPKKTKPASEKGEA